VFSKVLGYCLELSVNQDNVVGVFLETCILMDKGKWNVNLGYPEDGDTVSPKRW
jgi:hypothetical protein